MRGKRHLICTRCTYRVGRQLIDHAIETACPVQAWDLLREFTKAEVKEAAASYLDSPSERRRLRAALETVAKRPLPAQGWDPAATEKELLLGVLASDVRLAVRALRDWTDALHVPFVAPASRVRRKLSCWAPAMAARLHALPHRGECATACLRTFLPRARKQSLRGGVWRPDGLCLAMQIEGKPNVAQVTGTVFLKYNCRSQVRSAAGASMLPRRTLARPWPPSRGNWSGVTPLD